MADIKLKPCPFCGSALTTREGFNPNARCETAGCYMQSRALIVPLDDPRQVEQWNRRAHSEGPHPESGESFDDWYEPLEGFGFRFERAINQVQPVSVEALEVWLRAAYDVGRAAPPPLKGEALPVGEAGSMPGTDGFTMAAFRAVDVPIGTKLYARPVPGVSREEVAEIVEPRLANDHWIANFGAADNCDGRTVYEFVLELALAKADAILALLSREVKP